MNQNTKALLILAEQKFGLLTKAYSAQQALSSLEGKVHKALDAFSGASPEIPEGYMLIPLELSPPQKTKFAETLGTSRATAEAIYNQFIKAVSE